TQHSPHAAQGDMMSNRETPQNIPGLTAKIVSAYVSHNPLPTADLPSLVSAVHSALVGCHCKIEMSRFLPNRNVSVGRRDGSSGPGPAGQVAGSGPLDLQLGPEPS